LRDKDFYDWGFFVIFVSLWLVLWIMIQAMTTGSVFVFVWSQAEAEATAQTISDWGWDVALEWQDGGRGSQAVKAAPPSVLVFDLEHKPSHSRATAEYLAQIKATRYIPMVFVGGSEDLRHKLRSQFPIASFVSQDELQATLDELRPK
jgi:hypothetical protein